MSYKNHFKSHFDWVLFYDRYHRGCSNALRCCQKYIHPITAEYLQREVSQGLHISIENLHGRQERKQGLNDNRFPKSVQKDATSNSNAEHRKNNSHKRRVDATR